MFQACFLAWVTRVVQVVLTVGPHAALFFCLAPRVPTVKVLQAGILKDSTYTVVLYVCQGASHGSGHPLVIVPYYVCVFIRVGGRDQIYAGSASSLHLRRGG